MPHIRFQSNNWRVELCVKGIRKSRSFKSRTLAEAWAEKTELALTDQQERIAAAANVSIAKLIPQRVLDALALTDYTKTDVLRAALPCRDHCGVYFLIQEDDVIYVGKSINIFNRIARHRSDGREFDSFAYLLCPMDALEQTEATYITAFMPWLNIALGPSKSRPHRPATPPPQATLEG